ncbi:MAG: glycosyltransferase family 9 protein [Chlamydiia bacterium]|nr:glycosyltransferase family 9 protein [Chlamydiia bacterium]
MKYLIQNRFSLAVMKTMDGLLRFFTRHRREFPIEKAPQKILVCNTGFMGDAVIATTVLPALKKKFPDAKIGFLVASKSVPVIKELPEVTWIHSFDHGYVNKSLKQHLQTARTALQEIRAVGYDVAINLQPYFPNGIGLLYRSKIPVRIGYATGGLGPLLTHCVPFAGTEKYIGFAFLKLLQPLHIAAEFESPLPYYACKQQQTDAFVIHMGTSSELKEWPFESWKELIKLLGDRPLFFTGQGEREWERADAACQLAKNGINLCNRLNWRQFVETVQQAKCLISVDSAAIHVAAAAKVPTVALFTGIADMRLWLPPHPHCKGLIHKVLCSPCLNKRGCAFMACIRQITPKEVLAAVKSL